MTNVIYSFIGALNEAMSDIFGALVDSFRGKSENDIWLIGEDIKTPATPDDAMRYMCDPAKDNASRDYYPDRIPSTETPNKGNDYGGVHSNSGIANLGECCCMLQMYIPVNTFSKDLFICGLCLVVSRLSTSKRWHPSSTKDRH